MSLPLNLTGKNAMDARCASQFARTRFLSSAIKRLLSKIKTCAWSAAPAKKIAPRLLSASDQGLAVRPVSSMDY